MTHDELAEAYKALIDETHEKVDAVQNPAVRAKAKRLLGLLHGAADALKELAVDQGLVQPFSGGDPKPPGP